MQGFPEFVRASFWRSGDLLDVEGRIDAARLKASPPVAAIPIRARALFRHHIEDLGFDLARRRPELSGTALRLGLDFRGAIQNGEVPVPVLLAFSGIEVVLARAIHVPSLNREFTALAARRELAASGNLRFILDPWIGTHPTGAAACP